MTVSTYREFQPGEYGSDIIECVVPFPTLVASGSVTVNCGISFRNSVFAGGFVAQNVAGTFGGTATVTLQKCSGGVTTALTAAQSILSAGAPARTTVKIPALASLSDSQKSFQPGDVLEAIFTLSSTVSVQPVGGIVGGETYLIK